MYLYEIKRDLRYEIKKRENEQYFTFQTNVRQMCKDVLAKLEEQESVIAEKDKEIARLDDLAHAHNIELLCKENLIAKLQSKVTLASLADDYSSLRHKRCNYCSELQRQKYKRCLANAWWCLREEFFAEDCHCEHWVDWAIKWYKRWLAIAEKFKEAK